MQIIYNVQRLLVDYSYLLNSNTQNSFLYFDLAEKNYYLKKWKRIIQLKVPLVFMFCKNQNIFLYFDCF